MNDHTNKTYQMFKKYFEVFEGKSAESVPFTTDLQDSKQTILDLFEDILERARQNSLQDGVLRKPTDRERLATASLSVGEEAHLQRRRHTPSLSR